MLKVKIIGKKITRLKMAVKEILKEILSYVMQLKNKKD